MQLGFLLIAGLRDFTNHSNVLPIMHYLRQLFVVGLDKQIDLTFGFRARKIFGGARLVNAPLTQQELVLKMKPPFIDSILYRRLREISPPSVHMSFLHGLIYFLCTLGPRLSLKIFGEEALDILICAFPYLFKYPFFHQFLSLLTALLRGG